MQTKKSLLFRFVECMLSVCFGGRFLFIVGFQISVKEKEQCKSQKTRLLLILSYVISTQTLEVQTVEDTSNVYSNEN